MKLAKLIISNFQGIQYYTLEPNGENISIAGINGTGKTTIASSLSWLLFDKDSSGNSKFEIKPIDPATGEYIHKLVTSVTGTFILDDGGTVELKKEYKEVYTTKRGNKDNVFTGNTTDYYIDETPMKKKDYDEKINAIATEEEFRLLTTPAYFPETLPWKKRRDILFDICGNISDAEVIAGNKELLPLLELIGKKTVDEMRATAKSKQAKVKEKIEEIPIRISQENKSLPEEDIDLAVERSLKETTEKSLEKAISDMAVLKTDGQVEKLKLDISKLQTKKAQIENQHREDLTEVSSLKVEELGKVTAKVSDTEFSLKEKRRDLDIIKNMNLENIGDSISLKLVSLREEFGTIVAQKYEYIGDSCPNCGHKLSEKQDAEAAFNVKKSEKLEDINSRGVSLKAQLEAENKSMVEKCKELEAQSLLLNKEISTLEDSHITLSKEAEALRLEIAEITGRPVTLRPDHKKNANELGDLTIRLEKLESGDDSKEVEEARNKVASLRQALSEALARIDAGNGKEMALKRIKDLEEQEGKLAKDFEALENELHIIDLFERTRASMIEENVNDMFEFARFKLFEEHISHDGLKQVCEVTHKGVGFSSGLNTGMRMALGIDIINTLSKFYRKQLPIIIDNAESCLFIPRTDAQVIRLVVDANYDTLTVVS